MQWFTKEALEAWRATLPDDVLTCVDSIDDSGQDAADFISKLLPDLVLPERKAADEFSTLILTHREKFMEMGRPRRIRFLAWCTAQFYRDKDKDERLRLISKITETGSDEAESGSGTQGVGILFLEDIKAFAAALGPRAAALIVDENTLSTVAGVGLEMASDMELRGGHK
jgi:hypothetical protein